MPFATQAKARWTSASSWHAPTIGSSTVNAPDCRSASREARRTWVVWYTAPDGNRRKVTIGDVAGKRLKDAREEATRIVQGARRGQDEGAQRRAAREVARTKAADTLDRLIEIYLERQRQAGAEGSDRTQRPRAT